MKWRHAPITYLSSSIFPPVAFYLQTPTPQNPYDTHVADIRSTLEAPQLELRMKFLSRLAIRKPKTCENNVARRAVIAAIPQNHGVLHVHCIQRSNPRMGWMKRTWCGGARRLLVRTTKCFKVLERRIGKTREFP